VNMDTKTKLQRRVERRHSCSESPEHQRCWHLDCINKLAEKCARLVKRNTHLERQQIVMEERMRNQATTLSHMNEKAQQRNADASNSKRRITELSDRIDTLRREARVASNES